MKGRKQNPRVIISKSASQAACFIRGFDSRPASTAVESQRSSQISATISSLIPEGAIRVSMGMKTAAVLLSTFLALATVTSAAIHRGQLRSKAGTGFGFDNVTDLAAMSQEGLSWWYNWGEGQHGDQLRPCYERACGLI